MYGYSVKARPLMISCQEHNSSLERKCSNKIILTLWIGEILQTLQLHSLRQRIIFCSNNEGDILSNSGKYITNFRQKQSNKFKSKKSGIHSFTFLARLL